MLVAALRVKNESWVLRYTLSALSTFVDKIVIVDDASTDNTVEICKEFAKVESIYVNSPRNEDDADESRDWNRLRDLAISVGAEWILFTDADEMLEPKIADFVLDLDKFDGVDLIRFRKISPWKSFDTYRVDSPRFDAPAEATLNPILVRAKRGIRWHDGRGGFFMRTAKRLLRSERFTPSVGRGFPFGVDEKEKTFNCDDLVSVHFNHISIDRLIKKQVFYALVEKRMRPKRSRDEIVSWVSRGWTDNGAIFAPMDPAWIWSDFLHFIET